MDQLAGLGPLVAHDLAGGAVKLPQPWQVVAAQHGIDGGASLAELDRDAVRADPAGTPAQRIACSRSKGGRLGLVCGRELRSSSPDGAPGGMEGGGMHWDDRVAGGQQPVHHQPGRPFNDHRQFGRLTVASKSRHRLGKRLLGMPQRPAPTTLPCSSSTVTSWPVLAQSQSTNLMMASSGSR
jgi:hypothetical protein